MDDRAREETERRRFGIDFCPLVGPMLSLLETTILRSSVFRKTSMEAEDACLTSGEFFGSLGSSMS